jgi:nitronate monooxygenase
MWPNNRALDLFGIELPIIQAPMAGAAFSDMVIAVSEAGGLGSLACGLLSVEQARRELETIRRRTSRPINLNFFCHQAPREDPAREMSWRRRLEGYYVELGIEGNTFIPSPNRAPFDDKMCDLVLEFDPEVVSFHFGLPGKNLLARVRKAGGKIISSATCVDEARWLEDQGCDAIVAQGYEAGGHRGMFLTPDISTQVGTMALVPQVVDAVKVPVIAAGGIADARGIAAAFALGASAVQIGTAYLLCPEVQISPIYGQALKYAKDNETAVTNLFTGRPARGIVNRLIREVGPWSDVTPEFPLAAAALAPLRAKSETAGSTDFSPLWSGQAVRLACQLPAAELTKRLAREAQIALNHSAHGSSNVLVKAEALRVLAQAEALRR